MARPRTHMDATDDHDAILRVGLCGAFHGRMTENRDEVSCKLCLRKLPPKKPRGMPDPPANFDGDFNNPKWFREATVDPLPQSDLNKKQAAIWKHIIEECARAMTGDAAVRARLPRETRWSSVRQAFAMLVHVRAHGYGSVSMSDPDSFARRAGMMGDANTNAGPDARSRLAEDVAELTKALEAAFDGSEPSGRMDRTDCEMALTLRYVGDKGPVEIAEILSERAGYPIPPKLVGSVTRGGYHRAWIHLAERKLIPTTRPRSRKDEDMGNNMTDADLFGWQAIADHLGCSVGTAQRYHREDGLPVGRFKRQVEASSEKLKTWRLARTQDPAGPEAASVVSHDAS